MIGWFLGRMLRRNVVDNIAACLAMSETTRLSIAQFVIDKLESTEGLPSKSALIDMLVLVVRDAAADRHSVSVQLGAHSLSDPKWNGAGIVETWGNARLAYLTGRISDRAFDKVDGVVFRFVTSTLGKARLIDRWKD